MTIENSQPPQSPVPHAATPSSRPMPAKVYMQQLEQTGEITRADEVAQEPDLTPAPRKEDSQPPLISHRSTQQRKPHRMRMPLIAFLLLLIGLMGIASFFASRFFESPSISGRSNSIPGLTPGGSFVRPPLTPAQQLELMHLVGYMKYKQLASLYVSHMTLDEELGQLIMVEYADTYYSPDLDTMINKLHAGGVIMYEFQMNTFNQTKGDIALMQQHASIPLLISTDEEGGPYVHRLTNIYGPRMSATDIANTGDPKVATEQGVKAAHDLLALGINENLAPDVDVNLVNGFDMVTRTFGNTPQSVIEFASAYMQGLQGNGVVGCIKHYPGLGDATIDAHAGLPVVNQTRDQIYSIDLAPFKAFIQSPDQQINPGMIMPTDVLMPAIDPKYPAELSHIFMTDILRKQFGYDGVVLTDALYMKGVEWDMNQAAVLALNAGNDMLLGPTGADQMLSMINALKAALQNGTLAKSRIDEAATRIIALKMEYHLMPAVPPQE